MSEMDIVEQARAHVAEGRRIAQALRALSDDALVSAFAEGGAASLGVGPRPAAPPLTLEDVARKHAPASDAVATPPAEAFADRSDRIGVVATRRQLIVSALANGPLAMTQISIATGLDGRAVTGMLNRLHHAGEVERVSHGVWKIAVTATTTKAPACAAELDPEPEHEVSPVAGRGARANGGGRAELILNGIREHGPIGSRGLAKRLGVTYGAASGAIHKLAEMGLVERIPEGWRVAARETRKKPSKRPPKGADEEEGAVQVEPVRPSPRRVPLLGPIRPVPVLGACADIVDRDVTPAIGQRDVKPENIIIPGLSLGRGGKRDTCASYDRCLDKFVAKHSRGHLKGGIEPEGHCPTPCPHFRPISREEQFAHAMAGGMSALALAERN